MPYTEEELRVISKAIRSDAVQELMGNECWDLTEEEEHILWQAIDKAKEVQ